MQGTSSFKRAITCWHRSSTPGSLLLSKDRASQCCNSILPSYPYSKPIPGPSRIYSHSRNYSTSHAPTTDKQRKDDSIFSSSVSPWDHVFADLNDLPPLIPSSARSKRDRVSLKRQAMTAREINTFDEMFEIIFNASSEQKQGLAGSSGIGRGSSSALGDLMGTLRQQSKQVRWTTEADEELDRKREEMELCNTDQQLLDWAMREVFDESKRYEDNARRSVNGPVQLQPASYPHLVALLIRTFREKYTDPHLALSIFDYARHLSIPSYVFGCTTPAYNELIETRWYCFRDLRGVCDALEEMRVNGVGMDNRTRKLAEHIRREVGERELWQEESKLGSGEVWDMLARIERFTARQRSWRPRRHSNTASEKMSPRPRKAWSSDQESWKAKALNNDEGSDEWEFGRWDDLKRDSHPTAH